MNNWSEIKKTAIVEADDFEDNWARNGFNFLLYWKTKYPKFKITLYTIPNRTSPGMLQMLEQFVYGTSQYPRWIELAVHGWDHTSNFECYGWDYERTQMFMKRLTTVGRFVNIYTKNFKAPGWTITPTVYPAGEHDLIQKDKQGVYKALRDMDYMICDRHYNKEIRPEGTKIICIDCNPDIVHFHTWNVPSGDPNGRNGFQDVEEAFGVPWDQETDFYFMSEAWDKKLYLPCTG